MKCPYCDREDLTVLHTFRLGIFNAVKAKCNFCGRDSTHLESELLTSIANTIFHQGKDTKEKSSGCSSASSQNTVKAVPDKIESEAGLQRQDEMRHEAIRNQEEQKAESLRKLQERQAEELRIKREQEAAVQKEAATKGLFLLRETETKPTGKTECRQSIHRYDSNLEHNKSLKRPLGSADSCKPRRSTINPDTLTSVEKINWPEVLSDTNIKGNPPAFMPAIPLTYNIRSLAEKTYESKPHKIVITSETGTIKQIPQTQPTITYTPTSRSEVYVNIGFDWGASTTKVVYSINNGGTAHDPKVLRFDSYFKCEDDSNYLPLSKIVRYKEKLFILPNAFNEGIDYFAEEFFKAGIINSTQQGIRSITNEVYALFNISSLLAYTISEIKKETKQRFHTNELKNIKIRFGTPVESVNTDLARVFKRLFATAISIYDKFDFFSGYGVDYADMLEELKNRNNRQPRDGWDFDIIPEVFGALSSFVGSKQMKTDYFVIVDIGSCTMDVSFYLGSKLNKTLFAQRTAMVTMLGATNCERYIKHITGGKHTSIEWADLKLEAAFCNSISDFAKLVCHTVWAEDNPQNDVTIPYFIFGGGSQNALIVDKVKTYMQYGAKQYSKSKTLKYDMTYGVFIPDRNQGLNNELSKRLQVAFGLTDDSAARVTKQY